MLTRAVAVMVVAVVTLSVALGLTSPDGNIQRASDDASSPAPTPSLTPTSAPTTTSPPSPTDDLAPASVVGTWPGRPAAATVDGSDVEWCPAVTTDASPDAVQTFGADQVDAAACAAITFVLDHRYSRLSLPRDSYRVSDFDAAAEALSRATADASYRPRIAEFVKNPDAPAAASRLGLVLLRSADSGYTFYGADASAGGYEDRPVWINPQWTTVSVGVDRSKATPRLAARLTASAAIPVFNIAQARDDMMTVPTTATFLLRHEEGAWVIAGWTIADGPTTTAPLAVR